MGLDKEDVLIQLEDLYKSKLNAKITEIEVGKGAIGLKQISSKAYANDLNEKVMNQNPFILIGVSDDIPTQNGPRIGEKVTYSVILCTEDSINSSSENYKRMLRYQRCLKDVAKDNWKNFFHSLQLEVTNLQPVSFSDQNTNKMFKAVGVNITTDFYN